jgi:hypothetical protein
MRIVTTLLVSLTFATPLFAVPTSDRCPGEGPKPLAEVPWEHHSAVALPVPAPIQEFVLHERRGTIVYRDVRNQVAYRSLHSNARPVLAAPPLAWPLSSAHDPSERYLVAETAPLLFDLVTGRGWREFSPPVARPKPLFWGNGELYGMEQPPAGGANGAIRLFRHRPGGWITWKVCRNLWSSNETFALAEGSRYPYLSLYQRTLSTQGHGIFLYRLNVETCGLDEPALSFDKLPARAKHVQVVTQPYGAAIHVDEPAKRLLWYRQGACRYFDVDGADVSVPNPDVPLLAVRDTLKLWILDPEGERFVALKPALPATALRDRDIAITADGASVVVAPKHVDGFRRPLRIDLPAEFRRPRSPASPR